MGGGLNSVFRGKKTTAHISPVKHCCDQGIFPFKHRLHAAPTSQIVGKSAVHSYKGLNEPQLQTDIYKSPCANIYCRTPPPPSQHSTYNHPPKKGSFCFASAKNTATYTEDPSVEWHFYLHEWLILYDQLHSLNLT